MADEVVGAVQLRHITGFFAVTLTTRAAYAERLSPYSRLAAWVERVGVFSCGSTVSVFFGTPATAGSEPIRFSMCLPVSKPDAAIARAALAPTDAAGDAARSVLVEGDVVEVREFPRILAAAAFYRGSASMASAAYAQVGEWVREHPYLPTGSPREVYLAEPGVLRGDVVEIEVHQPVMPKPR